MSDMSAMAFISHRYPDEVAHWLFFVVIGVMTLLHAGVIFLLWQMPADRHRLSTVDTPIMVEILTGGGNSGSGGGMSEDVGMRSAAVLPALKPKLEK